MTEDKLPEWLATETAAKRLFQLFGFSVTNISVEGRQIDILAQKEADFRFGPPDTWLIEVTVERVGADKGARDAQKLLVAQKRHPGSKLLLISTKGFTDDQAASLKAQGITPLTWLEFESTRINMAQYAANALAGLKARSHVDTGYTKGTYVKPALASSQPDIDLDFAEFTNRILLNPGAGIGALLGDLGSGKTSLLERILEAGCENFLNNPGEAAVPLFVPLGRYKQHSGDIEQMIMGELRRAGQETYPTAIIRQLIDTRRIILLLDGLDEIHPIQNSDDILETVAVLTTSLGTGAVALISCRRQFFRSTNEELAYFGSFTASRLADIQKGIARILASTPATYIMSVKPFDRPRIEEYLALRCSMSKSDISDFFGRFYGFEQMAQTPVLLAMMATAINERLIEPTESDPFPLLTLYEAYTNRWIDRDKGRARLGAKQRRRLSLTLADQMLWKAHDSETWSQVREHLHGDDEWRNTPLTDEEAELDIRNSGFLVRDLDDRFRFIHRSIMEYFAAGVELERLASGTRPRHFPTDGFRLFLSMLMARQWLTSNPFGPKSWDRSRGDEVINAQLSMLAAATAMLPKGARAQISNIGVRSSSDLRFSQIHANRVVWRIQSGTTVISDSTLVDCEFTIAPGAALSILASTVERTKLDWEVPPGEVLAASSPLSAQEARLYLPGPIWDLADLCEVGAVITVAGKPWVLRRSSLARFSIMYDRLNENNRTVQTLRRGDAEFELIADRLMSEGWVEEWKRGKERGVMMVGLGNSMLGKLRKEPMSVQEIFERIHGIG